MECPSARLLAHAPTKEKYPGSGASLHVLPSARVNRRPCGTYTRRVATFHNCATLHCMLLPRAAVPKLAPFCHPGSSLRSRALSEADGRRRLTSRTVQLHVLRERVDSWHTALRNMCCGHQCLSLWATARSWSSFARGLWSSGWLALHRSQTTTTIHLQICGCRMGSSPWVFGASQSSEQHLTGPAVRGHPLKHRPC